MNLRRSTALAAIVAAAMTLAACGARSALAPRVALREAAEATSAQAGTTLTLSLVGRDADINALLDEGPPRSAEERKSLAVLRTSHLTVSTDRGADTASPADDRFAVDLTIGDVDHAVELRMVDRVLYARVDVAGLARQFDADPAAAERAVAGAGAAGLGFLSEAVAGRWISTDVGPLAAKPSGGPPAIPGLPAGGIAGLVEAVKATFGQNVAVARLPVDDTGDHYRLTVPLRQVYQRLLPTLGGLAGGLPGRETMPPVEAVPDRSVTADVWVSGGRIVRGELDLAQFAEHAVGKPTGRVALRLDIAPLKGGIKAPENALEVDLSQLFGHLAGVQPGLQPA
jgi:hypothetical protein